VTFQIEPNITHEVDQNGIIQVNNGNWSSQYLVLQSIQVL
jgi:hypothetical protein